jgi:hypothetical protein
MESMATLSKSYDTMNLVERRLALLVGAKLIDKEKISKATLRMELIRKKMSKKRGDFNGTEEIRKWRDERCKL